MAKIDASRLWALHYRLISGVIAGVGPAIAELGVDTKELFLLIAMDEHPYPAELSVVLSIPKPTVTAYLKSLEAAGLVKREIDSADLRRHRLIVTPAGKKLQARGQALLSDGFGNRLERLSAAEQGELHALLEKLI